MQEQSTSLKWTQDLKAINIYTYLINCVVCQEGKGDMAQGSKFDSRLVTFSVRPAKPSDLSEYSFSQSQNSNNE